MKTDIKLSELKVDFEIGGKKEREGGANNPLQPIPIVHFGIPAEGDDNDPNNHTLSTVPGLGPGNSVDFSANNNGFNAYNNGDNRVHHGAAYGAIAQGAEIEMQMIHHQRMSQSNNQNRHSYKRSVSDLGARASEKGIFGAALMSMNAADDVLLDDAVNAMGDDDLHETPGGDLEIDMNEEDEGPPSNIHDISPKSEELHEEVDDIENIEEMEMDPKRLRTDDGTLEKMLAKEAFSMEEPEEYNDPNSLKPSRHLPKKKSREDIVDEEVMLEIGKETPNPDLIDSALNSVDADEIEDAFKGDNDANYDDDDDEEDSLLNGLGVDTIQ